MKNCLLINLSWIVLFLFSSCSKEKLDNPSHIGDNAFLAMQGLRCIFGQDSVFCSSGSTGNGSGTGISSDTTPPTIKSISPADSTTGVSVTNTINVTFSETMNASSITAQSTDGTCSGSFQVSSDNFTTCLGGTLTTSANPTFTFSANPNLCVGNSYKVKITTSAKDTAGNALAAVSTSNGFSTQNPIVGTGAGATTYPVSMALYCNTLFLGGTFTTLGGQARNRLGSVDLTTGTTTSWNPNPVGGSVNVLVIGNSRLYVGGGFTNISSIARVRLASYDLPGLTLNSWNPNVDTAVSVDAILPLSGSIFIGGNFTNINGGTPRNHLAEVDTNLGSLTSWDPSPSAQVYTLADFSTNIFVGGDFNTIGGQAYTGVALVDKSTGSTIPVWNPGISGAISVYSLYLTSDSLYIGGNFLTATACNRNSLMKVDLTTGSCFPFDATINASEKINSIEKIGDSLYIGGNFSSAGGISINDLSKLSTIDSSDMGWNPIPVGTDVKQIKISGNVIYAIGNFSTMGGSSRGGLAVFDLATGNLLP